MLSNRHPLPAPGPISVLIWMPKDKGLNSSRPRITKACPQIFLRSMALILSLECRQFD